MVLFSQVGSTDRVRISLWQILPAPKMPHDCGTWKNIFKLERISFNPVVLKVSGCLLLVFVINHY